MCEWVMHGTALDGSVASEGVTSDTPTTQALSADCVNADGKTNGEQSM